MTQEVRNRKEAENAGINLANGSGNGSPAGNGGNGNGNGGNGNGGSAPSASTESAAPVADTGGSAVPAGTALTDDVPVVPARLHFTPGAAELGPACDQCGGMMQRTGACYTCSSCGNNTGCG
jgi:ribonucleoside-diphosphate reductase alpha chain